MLNRYLRRTTAEWRFGASPSQSELLEAPEPRARWWADTFEALLVALGRHARPERVEVTTGERGEGALRLLLHTEPERRALLAYLASCRDLCALTLDATPLAVGLDGTQLALDYALELRVTVEETDDHQPLLRREYPFRLSLVLHSDLYVEATFRDPPDNRELARANRDGLRALLHDLARVPGVEATDFESAPYPGQITRDGFVDLRAYRAVPQAEGYRIEPVAGGQALLQVQPLVVRENTLDVRYTLLSSIDAALARGSILQALVDGPYSLGSFDRIAYRDLHSGVVLETAYRRADLG